MISNSIFLIINVLLIFNYFSFCVEFNEIYEENNDIAEDAQLWNYGLTNCDIDYLKLEIKRLKKECMFELLYKDKYSCCKALVDYCDIFCGFIKKNIIDIKSLEYFIFNARFILNGIDRESLCSSIEDFLSLIKENYEVFFDEDFKGEFYSNINKIASYPSDIIKIVVEVCNLLQSNVAMYNYKRMEALNIWRILEQEDFINMVTDVKKSIPALRNIGDGIKDEIDRIGKLVIEISYMKIDSFEQITRVCEGINFRWGNFVQYDIINHADDSVNFYEKLYKYVSGLDNDVLKSYLMDKIFNRNKVDCFINLTKNWYFYDAHQYLYKEKNLLSIQVVKDYLKDYLKNDVISSVVGYLLRISDIKNTQEHCKDVIEHLQSIISFSNQTSIVDMLNDLFVQLSEENEKIMHLLNWNDKIMYDDLMRYSQNIKIINNIIFVFLKICNCNLLLLEGNKYEKFIIEVIKSISLSLNDIANIKKWGAFFNKILKSSEMNDDVKYRVMDAFLVRIVDYYNYSSDGNFICSAVLNEMNCMIQNNNVSDRITTEIRCRIDELRSKIALLHERSFTQCLVLNFPQRVDCDMTQNRFLNSDKHKAVCYSNDEKSFDDMYNESFSKKYISAEIFKIISLNDGKLRNFLTSWVIDQKGLYLGQFKELFVRNGNLSRVIKIGVLAELAAFIISNQDICRIQENGILYDNTGILTDTDTLCEDIDQELYNDFFNRIIDHMKQTYKKI